MRKIITILTPAYSSNTNWDRTPGKFNQLFTGLTGYDIMLEESRQDMLPFINNGFTAKSGQVMSSSLTNSIKKCLILLGRE